jgi:hypothetical protein
MRDSGIPAGKNVSITTTRANLAPTFLKMFGLPAKTDVRWKSDPHH